MIVKNLTRKKGSGQLLKYIFRYIFKSEDVLVKNAPNYQSTLKSLGIKFTSNDLKYLERELAEAKLMADFKDKGQNYLEYIQNHLIHDDKQTDSKILNNTNSPLLISHNLRSNSITGFIKEFSEVENERIFKRADQVAIHHTIISWSNADKDKITEPMLQDMANHYIRLRGEENLYAGTVHKDKDHIHLHIAMSGTQVNGRSSRIDKRQFSEVTEKLQQYQKDKYPELSNSLPEHGKSRRLLARDNYKSLKINERENVKFKLEQIVTAHSNDLNKLFYDLGSNGYRPYYRDGKINGVQYENGLKFRFSKLSLDTEQIREWFEEKETQKQELANIASIRSSSHELEKDEELELEDRFSTWNEDVDDDDSEKDTDDSGDESNIEDQENDDVHSLINDPEEDEDSENDDEYS